MAKGLDPKMVLVRLGTRDDLVAKFLKDNKKFDQERAEEEVSPPRRRRNGMARALIFENVCVYA